MFRNNPFPTLYPSLILMKCCVNSHSFPIMDALIIVKCAIVSSQSQDSCIEMKLFDKLCEAQDLSWFSGFHADKLIKIVSGNWCWNWRVVWRRLQPTSILYTAALVLVIIWYLSSKEKTMKTKSNYFECPLIILKYWHHKRCFCQALS